MLFVGIIKKRGYSNCRTRQEHLLFARCFDNKKETISRFKTGSVPKGSPSGKSSPLFSLLRRNHNVKESYDILDTDYLEAAGNGDEKKAAEYVEQASGSLKRTRRSFGIVKKEDRLQVR